MNPSILTPNPPYYAVIFRYERTHLDTPEYGDMERQMLQAASSKPGFLGAEHVEQNNGGILISYWESLSAVDAWRKDSGHRMAKARGVSDWYQSFSTRICKVEADNFFTHSPVERKHG
ncbi:MAG: antibiotic biosynthesis monooxygenase [Alicyclobacillaceae bacterium]|uniref:antibiotic biosynthesis monooxygenase family protein n=1 Tax=Alicyclobacillus sp. SP_1 TaxID=2942475 RepID=UPI0021576F7E|nr:antibiotic biosynthesis monooxygenase [Alicyclobacillus sp. SP_1]MCY0889286.1 antibiotic biosynthesis monooxygenase [Alicyclobacillaceae bacterium]MCY0894711.1 antibiotic biosynthesis monooxygenase [Alicyclobacillaceae bacterium]